MNKKDGIVDFLNKNGLIFTLVVAGMVLFTGISYVDHMTDWWIAPLVVLAFGVLFFITLNARVLIKSMLSVFIALLCATTAFRIGSLVDQNGTGGIVWMFSVLAAFFFSLSISYLTTSSRSRWSFLTLTTVMSFCFTSAFAAWIGHVAIVAPVVSLVFVILYHFVYRFSRGLRYDPKNMPTVFLDEEEANAFCADPDRNGWRGFVYENKDNHSVVMWNDDRCYQIARVDMDQAFGFGGRRGKFLTYHDKNINSWVLETIFKWIPKGLPRDVSPFFVVLDYKNANGKTAKVVGVDMMDSKKKIPMGIFPSRGAWKNKNLLLDAIDKEFFEYAKPLTKKQVEKMDDDLFSYVEAGGNFNENVDENDEIAYIDNTTKTIQHDNSIN